MHLKRSARVPQLGLDARLMYKASPSVAGFPSCVLPPLECYAGLQLGDRT